MPVRFQTNEPIRASIHHVWTVLADFERWPEWTSSITRIERLDSRPLGIGTRVRIQQPQLRPAIWVITGWAPGHSFTWEITAPGVRVAGSHILAPSEEGCLLTLTLNFHGWLGITAAYLKRQLTQRYMRLEAEGLKARSEGFR